MKTFKYLILSMLALSCIMTFTFNMIFHFTGYHFHIPIGSTLFIDENRIETTYSCAICFKTLDENGRDSDGKNFSGR